MLDTFAADKFLPIVNIGTLVVDPAVFQQLGSITRLLHDTMQQLGVMPKLQVATDGLPDARSRLSYIANKTADAANKVLNSVDQAKADHAHISNATRELAAALVADPVRAVASGKVHTIVVPYDFKGIVNAK